MKLRYISVNIEQEPPFEQIAKESGIKTLVDIYHKVKKEFVNDIDISVIKLYDTNKYENCIRTQESVDMSDEIKLTQREERVIDIISEKVKEITNEKITVFVRNTKTGNQFYFLVDTGDNGHSKFIYDLKKFEKIMETVDEYTKWCSLVSTDIDIPDNVQTWLVTYKCC